MYFEDVTVVCVLVGSGEVKSKGRSFLMTWLKGCQIRLLSHPSACKRYHLCWYRNGATPPPSISITLVSAEMMTWSQNIEGTLYHLTFI